MPGPGGPSKEKDQQANRSSGLHQPELRYLAIGKITRVHGLKGEVSVAVLTEFPERFEITRQVYVGDSFEAVPYQITHHRWHKGHVLLTFAGITNRTDAEPLKGQLVQIPLAEAMPLPDGEVYIFQLLGLEVFTVEGQRLGVLVDVLETGANDVYVVDNQGREILLPAINDVIKTIDLEQARMVVEVMEGLI